MLLVGGSSRIPLVPQMVSEQLGLPVRVDAHPKLVVARGAARQAGIEPAADAKPSRWARAPRQPEPVEVGDEDGGGRPIARLAVIAALLLAAAAAAYFVFFRDDDGGDTATDARRSPRPTPRRTTSVAVVAADHGGLELDRRRRRSLPVRAGAELWAAPTGGPIGSVRGPSVDADSVVFASQDGVVYRVTADDGSPLWSLPVAETVFSSPLIVGDTVYVGSSDGVRALALADGAVRWTAGTGVQFQSSPWVDGDTVFIGADDTNLYALDVATGAVRWQTPLGGAVFSSPVVAEGVVYVGSLDNAIYALDAATGEVRWRTPTGGPIYAVAGGRRWARVHRQQRPPAVRTGCGDRRHRVVVRDQRLDLVVRRR